MNRIVQNERVIVSIDALQLKALTARLDAIIRLECARLPEEMGQREKIKLLRESGLTSKDIAAILGIKDVTVRSVLSRSKVKGSPDEEQEQDQPSDSVVKLIEPDLAKKSS